MHRPNDGNLVDVLCRPGKQLADLNAAFAVSLETEWGWKSSTGFAFCSQVLRQLFPGMFQQRGLRIKRVDMRGSTIEEEMNDPFRARRKVRGPRRKITNLFLDCIVVGHQVITQVKQAAEAQGCQPPVPALKSDWIQSPIDAFVLTRLNKNDLVPSPAADKRVLIRRAYFKLTGLPPSPSEVAAFVQNQELDAYQELIERLLRSPHYGEKSARQWMDIARYSDTKGYVYAREERFWVHAWVYRDWLVKALNQDMPYDRFLLLQIAADQVATSPADLAAMGFLTLGRRFLGVTHDIIDDRIDVVTRGTMGLTVSCARCHDHKFDPVPTEDYYALYGVFQNSIERLEPLETDDRIDQGFAKQLKSRADQLQNAMSRRRSEAAQRIRERIDDYLIAQLEIHKYPEEGFDQVFAADDVLPAYVRRWRDYLNQAEKQNDNVFVAWRKFRSIKDKQFTSEAIKVCRQLQSQKAERVDPRVAAVFAEPPGDMHEVAKRYAQLFDDFRQQMAAKDPAKPDPPRDDPLWKVLFDDHSPCQVPHKSIVNNDRYFPTNVCEELWKLQKNVDRLLIDSPHALQYGLLLRDRKTITDARVFKRGNPASLGPKCCIQRTRLRYHAGS